MKKRTLRLKRGPYIWCEVQEIYGLAFAIGYIPDERDFQIALMLGNLSVSIGYVF
jgi:hypothetical protein